MTALDPTTVLEYFRPAKMRAEHLEVLGRRHKPDLADWMEENYYLGKTTSRIKGTWKRSITPYWLPVLEWLTDITTRVIWVIAATQTAKSTILGGYFGYIIDTDPGPTRLVVPDEKISRKRIKKLRSSFKASKQILRHFRGNDINRFLIGETTELDNMIFTLGWPTAPDTLVDDTCRYGLYDEVEKWVQQLPEGGDPISELHSRFRTFYNVSKQVAFTSPGLKGSLTWRNVQRCQQWHVWIRCSFCLEYHIPRWHNVQLDRKPDGHFFEADTYERGGKAHYVCPHCKKRWSEYERWDAVTHFVACPDGLEVQTGGQISGPIEFSAYKAIHFPCLLVHPMFSTVDILAAEFIAAWKEKEQGNIDPYKTFRCNEEAEFWEQRQRQTDAAQVGTHRDQSYRLGQVPRGVQMVTVGTDVQADHVWMVVMGFGYRYERWLLWAGRIETGNTAKAENWQVVEDMLTVEWTSAVDPAILYRAARGAIDCRYQRAERDEESTVVYSFCLRFEEGVVMPVLGSGRDRMKDVAYRVSKPLAGSDLKRYLVNVDAYKDRLWNGLHDPERSPGPGYMHLPADIAVEVIDQLSSEEQVLKEGQWIWRLKHRGARNHLLDATVYADFAAEIGGVFTLRDVDFYKGLLTSRQRREIKNKNIDREDRKPGFLDGLPTL